MTRYISGEHGPEFVGYGEVPKPSFWQRWKVTIGITAGLAVAALGIIFVMART